MILSQNKTINYPVYLLSYIVGRIMMLPLLSKSTFFTEIPIWSQETISQIFVSWSQIGCGLLPSRRNLKYLLLLGLDIKIFSKLLVLRFTPLSYWLCVEVFIYTEIGGIILVIAALSEIRRRVILIIIFWVNLRNNVCMDS